MIERPSSPRGDLMRRMADLQLQIDTLSRSGTRVALARQRQELEQQLEALKRLLVR
jgi:hypothetical protein